MADTFLLVIILIPLYAVLIWTYLCTEDSLLWGRRWMYKEEPEVSEGAIRYGKIVLIIGIIALTIILAIQIYSLF
ncbi:hypothetical protein [Neobacillus sp. PS3-40]|uniref:hypothetical protein n=1 Tax=Neobacillus sp. PS3-40 TaxID=3070679 RepID=UPI0027E1859C|nr:hypothetical protein [Neobacillus sp. PS3-40]WML44589.1 hypothetical protein RCG20_01350 [Neobacillus sp. PS3-40]